MRQEVFEIVQKMDKDNIRTQMALQCAPLITGLKVANLLIIPSKNEKYVEPMERHFARRMSGM